MQIVSSSHWEKKRTLASSTMTTSNMCLVSVCIYVLLVCYLPSPHTTRNATRGTGSCAVQCVGSPNQPSIERAAIFTEKLKDEK